MKIWMHIKHLNATFKVLLKISQFFFKSSPEFNKSLLVFFKKFILSINVCNGRWIDLSKFFKIGVVVAKLKYKFYKEQNRDF